MDVPPVPAGVYFTKNIAIHVFRAKNMYRSRWNSKGMRELIKQARSVYARYGDRERFDEFDDKAAIYAARIMYPIRSGGKTSTAEEWLSIRFVPGNGKPAGVCEPEIYSYRGQTLSARLQSMYFNDQTDLWKNIVSSSRMCPIHPYIITQHRTIMPLPETKNSFTAYAFAAIQQQFIKEYLSDPRSFLFLTEIIPNKLLRRALGVISKNGKTVYPPSVSARRTIKIPSSETVSLNRDIYAYRYPLYWLHFGQLRSLLQMLVRTNKLSLRSIQYYLETDMPISNILRADTARMYLRNLGALLTVRGKIKHSVLTGKQLRMLVDTHVSDVPELKITPVSVWKAGIAAMLDAARITAK